MAVRSEAKVLVLVAEIVESNPASERPDIDSAGMISLKQASRCVLSVSARIPSLFSATY